MGRPPNFERLDKLRAKQAEIQAEVAALEAQQKEAMRRAETRRRELVGEVVAAEIAAHPESSLSVAVIKLLAERLTRPQDRELFPALPSLNNAEAAPPAVIPAKRGRKPKPSSKESSTPAGPEAASLVPSE